MNYHGSIDAGSPLPAATISFTNCNDETATVCDPWTVISTNKVAKTPFGGFELDGDSYDDVNIQFSFDLAYDLDNGFTINPTGWFFIGIEQTSQVQGNITLLKVVNPLVDSVVQSGCGTLPDITAGFTQTELGAPVFGISNCQVFTLGTPCQPFTIDSFTDADVCSHFEPITEFDFYNNGNSQLEDPYMCPIYIETTQASDLPLGTNNFQSTLYDLQGSVVCDDITVNVVDNQNPVVICPASQTLEPEFCRTVIPPSIQYDNCGITSFVQNPATSAGLINVPGPNPVSVTVMDAAGLPASCSYTLTVPNPFAFPNCPTGTAPLTFNNDLNRCTSFQIFENEVGVADANCPFDTLYTNYPSEGYDYPVGIVEYQAIAHDGNDGVSECSFLIEIIDIEPPVFTSCPSDIIRQTDDPAGMVIFYSEPEWADNCPGSTTLTLVSGPATGSLILGTQTVTFLLQDTNPANQNTCSFDITVNYVPDSSITPTQTIVFLPSPSRSNSPTVIQTPQNKVTRDQISPSESNTPSRTRNPSNSATPTPTTSPSRSSSPTPTKTPFSPSNTPSSSSSASNTPSTSFIPPSETKSPYIPSASPTTTPAIVRPPFVQDGSSTLVEAILPCQNSVCTVIEVQFYLDEIAFVLQISQEDVQLFTINGHEATFLVCGSTQTAELLNEINAGQRDGFEGVDIESANFEVRCEPNAYLYVAESGSYPFVASLLFTILMGVLLL